MSKLEDIGEFKRVFSTCYILNVELTDDVGVLYIQ